MASHEARERQNSICHSIHNVRTERFTMVVIEKSDLDALKSAYNAYVQLPLKSTKRLLKHKAYADLLCELGGKYHAEPYQLRVLAGID